MADSKEPNEVDEDAFSGEKSSIASKASITTRKPPPETSNQIHVRTLVIIAFWAIVILLGLPIWWWTTSIHRSRLPLLEMLEWADGKVNPSCETIINFHSTNLYFVLGLQTHLSTADYGGCSVTT